MNDLTAALALVFIIEGILPFLIPAQWKQMMLNLCSQNDSTLRGFGLVAMIIGLLLLYWVRS